MQPLLMPPSSSISSSNSSVDTRNIKQYLQYIVRPDRVYYVTQQRTRLALAYPYLVNREVSFDKNPQER
jgi:hypothetical protein